MLKRKISEITGIYQLNCHLKIIKYFCILLLDLSCHSVLTCQNLIIDVSDKLKYVIIGIKIGVTVS